MEFKDACGSVTDRIPSKTRPGQGVRHIWSICAFDQMRCASGTCAFDPSPNCDSNGLTLTLTRTLTLILTPTQTVTLSLTLI